MHRRGKATIFFEIIRPIGTHKYRTIRGCCIAPLYPGVDLIFYSNRGQLEHDFIVAPGADYRQIALELASGGKIRLEEGGSVAIGAGKSQVRFSAPTDYQVCNGERIYVAAATG
jgi:hypothetical protein